MIKKEFILLTIILFFSFTNCTLASDPGAILEKQIKGTDTEVIQNVLDDMRVEYQDIGLAPFNFKELVAEIIHGEMDITFGQWISHLISLLFKELKVNFHYMSRIIFLTILASLLTNITQAFSNKSVAELGYYVVYVVLAILLMQSFKEAMNITRETFDHVSIILKSILPTLMGLLIMSGKFTSMAALYSFMLIAYDTIIQILNQYVINVIYYCVILEIINHITEKKVLKQMMEFMKSMISFVMKGLMVAFVGITTIQRFSLPIMDNLINKASKYAIGNIPVVGSTLVGVVDTVYSCSIILKNAFGIGAIIVIIIICLLPVVKLAAFILIYKVSAIILEPLSENRIVQCLSSIGDFCILLFGNILLAVMMFIIAISLLISLGNTFGG